MAYGGGNAPLQVLLRPDGLGSALRERCGVQLAAGKPIQAGSHRACDVARQVPDGVPRVTCGRLDLGECAAGGGVRVSGETL